MPFKFCPECGAEAVSENRFCASCGGSIATAAPDAAAAPTSGAFRIGGFVVLALLLLAGGGFWGWERSRAEERALKPGERRTDSGAVVPVQAPAPQKFELPPDIRDFIAKQADEAAKTPDDADAWGKLAGVYYRASRLDPSYVPKAGAAYQHLLDRDEKNLTGLRGLGNLAYDQGARDVSVTYYEKFLVIEPDNAAVRTDLGTMRYELGDSDAALAEWDRAIEGNPEFYQAYFNRGIVYDKLDRRDEALAELAKARQYASDPVVQERLSTLIQAANESGGSLEEAAAIAAKKLKASPTQPNSPHPPRAVAAPTDDTFRSTVARLFRNAKVAGPKVVRLEWPTEDLVRVEMAGFPMDQMPEVMKVSFLGKMKSGIQEAEKKFSIQKSVRVEIVDEPSGKVMAQIDN
jgi:tetratricopeptide (TPR) repeat protein